MMKPRLSLAVLTLALAALGTPAVASAQQTAATPAEAANFMGVWNVAMQGPQGPLNFKVTLSEKEGKVVGEITSAELGTAPVTSISRDGEALLLRYSADFQGTPLNMRLTLARDGERLRTNFDVNEGQFTLPGIATKG